MAKMVIYHIDQEMWGVGSKCDGYYPKHTQWLWGHIVTNKAIRTPERYAIMMDPEGAKAHYITQAMFRQLKGLCEHKYMPVVKEKDVNDFVGKMPDLTADQLARVVEAAQDHPLYGTLEVDC